MTRLRLALLGLACALAACSSPSTPAETDSGSTLDSTIPNDAFAGGDGGSADTGSADTGLSDTGLSDTGAADTGAPEDTGIVAVDTGLPRRDVGIERPDAAGIPAGQCADGPCTPTCFRPYECVRVCGGPITMCGCCPCAPGSIDTIECPPAI